MACITSLPAFCGVVGRVHVHLCGFVVCDLGIRIEFLLCSGKGLSAGEPADFSHALLNDFRFASLNGKIALEKCHFFFLWITVLSNEIAGVSGVLSSLVLRVISSRFMGVSLCFFMTIFVTPRKWSKPIIAMVLRYGRAPPNWSVFVRLFDQIPHGAQCQRRYRWPSKYS